MSNYDDKTLKMVERLGALQYNVEKVIVMLNPEDPEQFKKDLQDTETVLNAMYQSGLHKGKYNLDAQAFKQAEIDIDQKRKEAQDRDNYFKIRKELFGV